jgi:hypothetical protein
VGCGGFFSHYHRRCCSGCNHCCLDRWNQGSRGGSKLGQVGPSSSAPSRVDVTELASTAAGVLALKGPVVCCSRLPWRQLATCTSSSAVARLSCSCHQINQALDVFPVLECSRPVGVPGTTPSFSRICCRGFPSWCTLPSMP